jgi:hypothetical protein
MLRCRLSRVLVDFTDEDHEETMLALGYQSKREITRTRIRVRTAMAAQTREQGRYLGGRPPYGYQLADAGPHPNKAHAAWGRRAHRLDPNPHTAPVVTWMFAQRLESAWSNGKPAYRCRHGYTSATRPDPARPKNLYIREDTILPRLAALAILHAGDGHLPPGRMQVSRQVTAPAQAADQIEQLRATGASLIYDPATKTLRTDGMNAIPVAIG